MRLLNERRLILKYLQTKRNNKAYIRRLIQKNRKTQAHTSVLCTVKAVFLQTPVLSITADVIKIYSDMKQQMIRLSQCYGIW